MKKTINKNMFFISFIYSLNSNYVFIEWFCDIYESRIHEYSRDWIYMKRFEK